MSYTALQPKDGDRVMHCGHIDTGPFHFFMMPGTILFQRPNGTLARVKDPWLVVCEKCFIKYSDPTTCIRGEAIWNGNEPFIEKDVIQ